MSPTERVEIALIGALHPSDRYVFPMGGLDRGTEPSVYNRSDLTIRHTEV